MTELRNGMRVRVEYEGVIQDDSPNENMHVFVRACDRLLTYHRDLITPIDDPSKDPVGTVRRHAEGDFVKVGDAWWTRLFTEPSSCHRWSDEMIGCPIVARPVWEVEK